VQLIDIGMAQVLNGSALSKQGEFEGIHHIGGMHGLGPFICDPMSLSFSCRMQGKNNTVKPRSSICWSRFVTR
jgi:hypothetical protein